MSRRLNRVWLLLLCLITGEVWALGLGDIRLDSALNEPLRAEIQLLSATPEEIANLTIAIASADTFERYGIDRPLFMRDLEFSVVPSGRTDGNIIRVTSISPVTEPFLTFLVEASWSRGRLLREYTLLLDPPTFAPPATMQAPRAVTAPTRSTPADSGRITRSPLPAATQAPAAIPRPRTEPDAQPEADVEPVAPPPVAAQTPRVFDASPAGDVYVQRGDTLWGIASRVRNDNRLTINQMMLVIYEANPGAFAGNINRLSAGATLRIPGADDVFRISRGDALSEVQRQHALWGGVDGVAMSQPEPSLTLVPPDEDSLTSDSSSLYDADDLATVGDFVDDSDTDAADARIFDVRGLLQDQKDGLIVIGDNELAALRAELVALTGEELPPELMADDPDLAAGEVPTEDIFVDGADEAVAGDATGADDAEPVATDSDATTEKAPVVVLTRTDEPGLVDTIIAALTGIWGLIGAALLVVAGVLVWFARRASRSDDADTGMWEALDADEQGAKPLDSTERLSALVREDESTMVVVEEEALPEPEPEPATMEMPAAEEAVAPIGDALAGTGTNQSLEDTFSSDTAINLDQTDPIAEADFHMAYGLYDQAADLINGALAVEPERQDLLTKLCEIYFVWGNRDAFVDAATRLKSVSPDEADPQWDKIVIMGQQIAADHEMFADVTPGAATRAVDLSLDEDGAEAGELDMDFAVESEAAGDDIIDLGAAGDADSAGDASSIDFAFDEEPDVDAAVTQQMPTVDASVTQELPAAESLDDVFDAATVAANADDSTLETPTVETPASADATAESPTIEQQLEATGEMPSLAADDATEVASLDDLLTSEATAEIDLDDLGLDLDSLADGKIEDVADADFLSDLDDTAESQTLKIDDSMIATGRNQVLEVDDLAATGQNPELADDIASTGMHDLSQIEKELAATGEMPTIEEVTGRNPALPGTDLADTDFGVDTSLLDATGQTQVLPEDFVVETGTGTNIQQALADDDATMLASLDDDEEAGDFDYAKTEALPADAFTGDMSTDETGEMPGIAAGSTDLDLDLDDLTAALKVSAVGDTIDQKRDDATVEQPRPDVSAAQDDSPTAAIAPEDLSGDLHDARTMTEVGTKLDLARAYVDMGDPNGARSILEEVLDEGDEAQRQQAQQLLDSLPS
ncbi:MAG: hypothetical protein IIB76_01840 [Proteobacteria bacterium]|nr:hypothetical protein [Pseudomonadota bacterium]